MFTKEHLSRKAISALSAISVALFPITATASSWSPTLLVNTEAFQAIDDGDGASDIELRFGTSGKEIRWNVTESTFQFDGTVEVQGTASGRVVHAQDKLTTSGSLVVDEGKTISLNGVEYLFPYGDGSASGKVLKTDGAGNLVWSADLNTGTQNVFETFAVSGQSNVVADQSSDTLTLAAGTNVTLTTDAGTDTITITATDTNTTYGAGKGLTLDGSNFFSLNDSLTGSTLSFTTISGSTVHAESLLTSSGDIIAEGDLILHGGNINFGASTTIGDGGDQITIDSNGTLVINDGIVDFSAQTVDFTLNNAADSLNFDSNTLSIDASSNRVGVGTAAPDTALEVVGTVSGSALRAQDSLTSSGTLVVEGAVTFAGLTSCTNMQTDSAGVLSCNTTDYLEETELDSMSELETQIGGSNIITATEIDSESEFESVTGLSFFTAEEIQDEVNTLLRAGTGILLTYSDSGNALTIHMAAGSGNLVYLNPEYDGAVYYGDGSSNVGQMVLAYDSSAKENYYKWTSTNASLQDYNIAIRVRIPTNFSRWNATPIQFRYRTNAASADDNKLTMTMFDTGGNAVSLTGGADLVNTSWTTASITGPESSGTFTPGSYVTIVVQGFARTTNTGEAHAGYINLNWTTSTP